MMIENGKRGSASVGAGIRAAMRGVAIVCAAVFAAIGGGRLIESALAAEQSSALRELVSAVYSLIRFRKTAR